MNIEDMVARLGEDEYHALKQAVERGKWPDGRRLDGEEQALLMQAMILWEQKHRSVEARTGYLEAECQNSPAADVDQDRPAPLRWDDSSRH